MQVPIEQTYQYEAISAKVEELAAGGASVNCIAATLGKSWDQVKNALAFAKTGRPAGTRKRLREAKIKGHSRVAIDASEVVRLRDEQYLSFRKNRQQVACIRGSSGACL